jgi:phosphatidylinositol glycan class B
MLLLLFLLRCLNALLLRSYFDPDEYWQSLEVAHLQIFGYGHLTWEWHQGIRSYVHPLLFAGGYSLLKTLGLDHGSLLVSHF